MSYDYHRIMPFDLSLITMRIAVLGVRRTSIKSIVGLICVVSPSGALDDYAAHRPVL